MKRIVKVKESELRRMIENMLNEQQVEDPETMEPEVEPGVEPEIDEPDIKPDKEPWEDPFTPRRIQPGQEPQPRAKK